MSAANAAYAIAITVTDAAGTTASKSFSGTVSAGTSALVFNSSTISPITAGIAYSFPLVVTNGVSPYTFAVTSGTLPTGMTLGSSTGVIGGTPAISTSGAAYVFSITVTDSASQTQTKTYTGSVGSTSASTLSITTSSISSPTAGSYYVAAIGVSGGTLPYTFTVSSGTLPTGVSISSSTGIISGTPALATKGAAYLFTITATDANSLTSSVAYSGTIGTYATQMFPASLPTPTPNGYYSNYLSTTGGATAYTYSLYSGTMPSGLTLGTSTGLISGTVAASEASVTRSFVIRSTDANGVIASTSYSVTTNSFAVSVSTSSLAGGVEGTTYTNSSTNLGAAGGTGPYTYSYTGTLPSGVGLTSAGAFFGTPAAGSGAVSGGTTYTIYVTAIDSTGVQSATKTLTLNVTISLPSVTTSSLSSAVLGSVYSSSLAASGGRSPYTYAVTVGSLPTGLALSSAGVFSGTPTASASCPTNQFTVRVTDALSQISSASVQCIATVNGVSITNTSFPVVVTGVSYGSSPTVAVVATGGNSPYTYGATGLPSGISLNTSTGALTGFTNASVGTYTAYITATDSSSPALSTTRTFTFNVANPVTLTGSTLARAGTGITYAGATLAASGGQSPYSYAITSGSLPAGLSMSTAGTISGNPLYTAAVNGSSTPNGAYTFSVVATDSLGSTSSAASYTINVTRGPTITSPSTLPNAVLNVPYAYDIKHSGGANGFGTSSYGYTITGLPAGLSYGSSTGRIYGTPTTNAASPYTINVTMTDQYGFTATKSLTLTVASAGKTLDLKTGRMSDPCLGYTSNANCTATAHDIAQITSATTTNVQQFLIYGRTDTTPSIQIAKIDSTGRIPLAGSSVTTINIALPSNIGGFGQLRVADIDQDGYKDIVFTDPTTKQLCVLWNAGSGGAVSVDTYGMPSGFSSSNIDCFALPYSSGATIVPQALTVRNDLRPDSTNNGRQDAIVTMTLPNTNSARSALFILKNICNSGGNCSNATTQRPVIFGGFTAISATLNGTTTVTVPSSTGLVVGQQIVGVGIPAGATISTIASGTSITISSAATISGSSKLSVPTVTTSFNITTTSGSASVTATSTAGLAVGQYVTHKDFPAGTTILTVVNGTTLTMSNLATAASSTNAANFYSSSLTAHVPNLLSNSNAYLSQMTNIGVGWFLSAKPTFPVSTVNGCPAILIDGTNVSSTGQGYLYAIRQTYSSSQCQGDFWQQSTTNHASGDELQVSTATPTVDGIAVADYNNDGISDIAVGMGNPQSSSANIKVIIPAGGSTVFGTLSANYTTQLQSRGTTYVGAAKLLAYCIDGSSTCSYPALVATCGQEYAIGKNTNYGCLAVLPNSCTNSSCTAPFESTPTLRIDYPAPNGQNQEPIAVPLTSTSNGTPTATTISSSSPSFTVSSTAGLAVGQLLTASGYLPVNSYITGISGSTVTISQNASANGSNVAITVAPNLTPTGTAASGSPNITSVSSTNGLFVGQTLTGSSNIPANSYITAISGSTVTINQNATGSGSITLTIPTKPTLNDIAFAGYEQSVGAPYFMTYARNGSSSTDPFKGATAIDAFPAAFQTTGDIGTTRLTYINSDSVLDLFNFSPSNGIVGTYVSSSGTPSYSLGNTVTPTYLANPSSNGCSTSSCYPDPAMNPMGVQQSYPNSSLVNNQNIMDIGDFNGDGIPDAVVVGYYSRGISVALGTNTGSSSSPVLLNFGSGSDLKPQSLAVADLDNDGIPDIVAVGVKSSGGTTTGVAYWFKGNGDGSFQTAADISTVVSTCTDPRSVAAVDIDLDGRPEIAVLCYTTQIVWISRRHTDGTWILQTGGTINNSGGTNGVAMKWGHLTTSTATGLDVAIGGLDSTNSLRIINNVTLSVTNASTGSFTLSSNPATYISLDGWVSDIEIADINADGYGDLAVTMQRQAIASNYNGFSFYTCTSTGTGTCTKLWWGGEGYTATSASAGDVTGDGLPELFVGYRNDRLMFRTLARILNISY